MNAAAAGLRREPWVINKKCAGDKELDEYYTEEMPFYGYYLYRSKDEKEAIDASINIKEE